MHKMKVLSNKTEHSFENPFVFTNFVPNMKQLDFDELWENRLFDYKDGDLLLIDDFSRLNLPKYENTSVSFIMWAYCQQGRFQVRLDGADYRLDAGQLLVYTPGEVITDIMLSQDADVKLLAFARRAIERSEFLSKFVWKKMEFISLHPVFILSDEERQMFHHYYRLLMIKSKRGGGDFQHDVVRLLFQACLFDFMMITDRRMDEKDKELQERFHDSKVRQSTLIYRKFIHLLSETRGRMRNVSEFAENLNVSPKYLSKCVKQESGQRPIQFIHQTTAKEIARLLRYSDMSVKEISDDLNFPNISFFGKFVREQLGTSPTKYREEKLGKATPSPGHTSLPMAPTT